MKIIKIKVIPINIRNNFHYVWSAGVLAGFSRQIILVETDEGITGLGETTNLKQGALIEDLSLLLIGKDPLEIVDCEFAFIPELKGLTITGNDMLRSAFGAIDMALWDIKGKAAGLPLYKMLGGAYRKDILFTEYFSMEGFPQAGGSYVKDTRPEAIAEYCIKMREEHGSTLFEGKIATSDNMWDDLEYIRILRERIGKEATIRLDANYGYTLSTAKQLCKHLEDLDIRNIEDPVPMFEDMAELKKYTRMNVSTHICDLRRAVYAGAPDGFCTHPILHGGIMNTIRFIGACEAFGKDVWFYSGDTGITTAVYMHLAAACQHVHEPSQSLIRWQIDDVIEGGPFKPVKNVLRVPEEPGIGVKLDEKALSALHNDFVNNGDNISQYYNFKDRSRYVRLPRA
jgi:glucarate dehydratase